MAAIASEEKPGAAALVTGVDTPEGRAVAQGLARAGYRVAVLRFPASQATLDVASLPGHDKLRHIALDLESFEPAALTRAAQRAEEQLGHVTALVHVAIPHGLNRQSEGFEASAFGAELVARAGTFLALGLALLPGMFGTQTGTFCVLTRKPRGSFADTAPGTAALLGALLGGVRELADRVEGTPLRSIALYTDSPGALAAPALATLRSQLGYEPGPGLIENGQFASVSSADRGPVGFLSPPPVAVAAPLAPAAAGAPGKDRVAVQLAQTFRSAFGLAPNADVSNLAIASVKRWDSLGHLKLMMEVEQALRVRLPADALSRIQSYKDLEKAVRANLPAK